MFTAKVKLSSSFIYVETHGYMKVSDFKSLLEKKTHQKTPYIRLKVKNAVLDDANTLNSYKIARGVEIEMDIISGSESSRLLPLSRK